MESVARENQMPLIYSPPHLCTDNAAMIAWMGWELMNAEQDVDIRDCTVNALKKIPLGSYVEGFVNAKSNMPNYKKIMTPKNFDLQLTRDRTKIKGNMHKF